MGSLAGWGLDGWGAELKPVVTAPRISSLSADFSAFTCTRRIQVSGFRRQSGGFHRHALLHFWTAGLNRWGRCAGHLLLRGLSLAAAIVAVPPLCQL